MATRNTMMGSPIGSAPTVKSGGRDLNVNRQGGQMARAKFTEKLKYALSEFDLQRAEALSEEIHEAEEDGYVLTVAEDRLWERLTRCIDSYRRISAAIEG